MESRLSADHLGHDTIDPLRNLVFIVCNTVRSVNDSCMSVCCTVNIGHMGDPSKKKKKKSNCHNM